MSHLNTVTPFRTSSLDATQKWSESPYFAKSHLPVFNPETAVCLNQLFAESQTVSISLADTSSQWKLWHDATLCDGLYSGQFDNSLPVNTVIELSGANQMLAIAISTDAGSEDLGGRSWQEYDSEFQVLAWTLAHEQILQHLSTLFGLSWQVKRIVGWHEVSAENTLAFRWSVRIAGQLTEGVMTLSESLFIHLQTHSHFEPSLPSNSPIWRNTLSIPLQLALTTPPFSLCELKLFKPNDIMIINPQAYCWQNIHLFCHATKTEWLAAYEQGILTLKHRAYDNSVALTPIYEPNLSSLKSHSMTSDLSDVKDSTNSNAQKLLDQLPVNLQFQLGELTLTLAELEKLQPGYIFELPLLLDNLQTKIVANGQYIGQGDLVVVGQSLSVRLREFNHNGIQ